MVRNSLRVVGVHSFEKAIDFFQKFCSHFSYQSIFCFANAFTIFLRLVCKHPHTERVWNRFVQHAVVFCAV